MSETTTKGIRVQVTPNYLEHESDPTNNYWFHIYHVTIINESDSTVQLISRHWIITNARGEEEHVRGAGVVGNQPILQPNQRFQYTSACPLSTSMGTMHGSYQMRTQDGVQFDAEIAPFTLCDPIALN